MKAIKIVVNVPAKYIHAAEDRDFLHVGQKLIGYVQLDSPARPKKCEIRWLDSRGRLLGRSAGDFDAYQRRVNFQFDLDQNLFWIHTVECSLDGVRQSAVARFPVAPTSQGWETAPAITWATYPEGDFYDRLMEVGVNGIIAYRMVPYEHVTENAMRHYVDQTTYDEISLYHRPFKVFWEPPADRKGVTDQADYNENWKLLLERYVRIRARAKKEGIMISRDPHYRKLLWRAFCPNDPGTVKVAADRFAAVVRQHKGFRPLFQNMADEAGIGDQTRPFDFCYCPFCMDKFRLKLQKKYGSLAETNRQWGTDFAHWNDVYPLTCDETIEATVSPAARNKPLNFASWADHRAFMDDTIVEFFGEVRLRGQWVDPIGTFSQGGCQWPTIYGGWDYAKIVSTVDAVVPYNIGGNQEIIRSIRPELKNLSPFFGDDPRHVRNMWYAYIHGDSGIIFWDADEKTGRFVTRPSGKISLRGKRFGPALREMRGGYAQLFKTWQRVDEPIGLLYSQPTERAHWMLETLDDRPAKQWFDRIYRSRYVKTRQSWQRIIEDRQLQYRYLSYLDIDNTAVDLRAYRLIVLPETLAISPTLARALRQFVNDGGVLVADGRCGRFAENCRQAEAGVLDDLFGVTSGGPVNLKTGKSLQPVKNGWVKLDKGISGLKALDPSLRLAPGSGAEPAARAGTAPAVIRRKVGAGWAIYLNCDLNVYDTRRHLVSDPAAEAARKLVDALVNLAAIQPAGVSDQTFGSTAALERTRFASSDGEAIVLLPNREWSFSGTGEKLPQDAQEVFEVDRKVTLVFNEPAHTWNSRTGKYLGRVDAVRATVPRLTPLIVTRLPYRVTGLTVTLPGTVAAGEHFQIAAAVRTSGAATPVEHVFRIDVYSPTGQWCHWYSQVLPGPAGQVAVTVPLALNDAPGSWRVDVRDIVTGTTASKPFRVRAAKVK